MVFGVLLTAGVVQVAFGPGGHLPGTQSVLWLVLILAAGTRQMLLAADNATLRRGLERRVREQTADLSRLARQNEVLLTSVGDGIYGVDHDGRVTFINPSGAAALGYDPRELHGRRAHDAFHAPDDDGMPYPWSGCYITDAILSGMVASAEEDVYVRADGETFPVEITASPLVDDDEVRGAVVVFRDVTQRREVERMKNEFLSVVSHELRTPLTSIRGSLGLLAGGKLGELPPRADSLVGIALQSSERLTRLINDLLDIERIEAGHQADGDRGPRRLRAAAQGGHLHRGPRVRDEGPGRGRRRAAGRVLADEDRIMQTLTNLLGNAIKYSEPGDSVVVLDATERPDHVLFRVTDQGRGIPAGQAGDGLRAVRAGRLLRRPREGRHRPGPGHQPRDRRAPRRPDLGGERARLRDHRPVHAADRTGGDAPAGTAAVPARADGSVLLVEDDADLARVITTLLTESGLDVVHAATAAEAVARARERHPRAMVLDLGLADGGRRRGRRRRSAATATCARRRWSSTAPPTSRPTGAATSTLGRTAFLTKGPGQPRGAARETGGTDRHHNRKAAGTHT